MESTSEEEEISLDAEESVDSGAQQEEQEPAEKKDAAKTATSPSPDDNDIILWQTQVRNAITPYLPPPVVQSINRADLELEPYVGPEGSITILSTLLIGWLAIWLVRSFTGGSSSSGRALADEEEDAILSSADATAKAGGASSDMNYDATVLLVGPAGGGKTRLFYRLCYGSSYSRMPTLTSLKANVGIGSSSAEDGGGGGGDGDNASGQTIRYMDWPGHASLTDSALQSVLRGGAKNSTLRTVFVLDSTQPVAPAADVLDQLLASICGAGSRKNKTTTPQNIFIACHKTDFPKAKNWRRIKIQLRTELRRLVTVAATKQDNSSSEKQGWWDGPADTLDWDAIPGVSVHFCSTSSEKGRLSPELIQFCQTGQLPEPESSS